jgi:integrase
MLPSSFEQGFFNAVWSIRHLSKNTQKTYSKHLRRLSKDVDLNNSLKVEQFALGLDCKNKTRNNYFMAYQHYCKANGLVWDRPNLKNERFPVKVPTEERINMVISSATPRYSTIFHLSKMGLRPDEISKIMLRDVNLESRELIVRTSKLGLERTLKLKREVVDLLKDYLGFNGINGIDERLFPRVNTIRNAWWKYRNRAFKKFKDPELLKIRLYDLRHWFGTTEYIKNRDIFHVKYLMGHRNIESTLHYMHVAKGLVNYSDDYTVKVASSIEEFTELLESGFEYVSDYEGRKVLRKRK